MKRRGFIMKLLAALGVMGLRPTRWKPVRGASISYVHEDVVISGLLGHSLEVRLRAMIARDRAMGLEVRWFHTNRDTLDEIWNQLNYWSMADVGGYTAYMFEGVQWWGREDMADGEITISNDESGQVLHRQGHLEPWTARRLDI